MKRIAFTLLFYTALITTARAQIQDSIVLNNVENNDDKYQCLLESVLNTGFGFGMQLCQYQQDFGMGLNVTSPLFVYERVGLRLRGNLMFNEHLEAAETTLTPYSNVSIGFVGVSGKVGEYIRLYGEGGMIALFPSADFSSEQIELGGYGHLGVEFFMDKSFNYFAEIGHVGTGAIEDKVAANPLYSNGLTISVGLRVYLK